MSDHFEHLTRALMEMRRSVVAGRPKPHKPLMLLAVLDLFDAGLIKENRIPYNMELVERFGEYFRVVAEEGDWCQPAPPFFHLRGNGFWKHKVLPGREAEYGMLQTSGGGSKRILDNIQYAYLDDDAFVVFSDREQRHALREFIVNRFFAPKVQQRLWKLIKREVEIGQYEAVLEGKGLYEVRLVPRPIRDAAFSRMIRRIYDYQCAMCGLRIIAPDGSTPIDAAHLIPWSESHDDSPANGIALCKLHHWALDAALVAPDVQFKWVVSPRLDRRRNSERELTRFHRAPILLPQEQDQYPRPEAVVWRLNRLAR